MSVTSIGRFRAFVVDGSKPVVRRYRIEKAIDPSQIEGFHWVIHCYEEGKWFGACCYESFAEALADYSRQVRR